MKYVSAQPPPTDPASGPGKTTNCTAASVRLSIVMSADDREHPKPMHNTINTIIGLQILIKLLIRCSPVVDSLERSATLPLLPSLSPAPRIDGWVRRFCSLMANSFRAPHAALCCYWARTDYTKCNIFQPAALHLRYTRPREPMLYSPGNIFLSSVLRAALHRYPSVSLHRAIRRMVRNFLVCNQTSPLVPLRYKCVAFGR